MQHSGDIKLKKFKLNFKLNKFNVTLDIKATALMSS